MCNGHKSDTGQQIYFFFPEELFALVVNENLKISCTFGNQRDVARLTLLRVPIPLR